MAKLVIDINNPEDVAKLKEHMKQVVKAFYEAIKKAEAENKEQPSNKLEGD